MDIRAEKRLKLVYRLVFLLCISATIYTDASLYVVIFSCFVVRTMFGLFIKYYDEPNKMGVSIIAFVFISVAIFAGITVLGLKRFGEWFELVVKYSF